MATTPEPLPVLERPAEEGAAPRMPLRLAAAGGALGLELYEPVELAPLTVVELAVRLPGVRFPVDLSGGVRRFRTRRGVLERSRLEGRLGTLEAWIAASVQAAFDEAPTARLWHRPGGLGLGLLAGARSLAVDLFWIPTGDGLRIVASEARGVGTEGPPLALALRVLDTLMGAVGRRRGRVVEVPAVASLVARTLLPALGCRAPDATGVAVASLERSSDEIFIALDRAATATPLEDVAVAALELARLTEAADEALVGGDVDGARNGYLEALERAPRHPELCRLVAELDVLSGGREDAALGLLVESQLATGAGLVGARLLAAVGDVAGAREAVDGAARNEPFPPVAAHAWLELARLEASADARLVALDQAVAAAPSLPQPRWARLQERVHVGDVEGALADAEHLEGAASGRRARFEVVRAAADVLLEAGFVQDGGRLFERALRYVPDDAEATAGLGRALRAAGRLDRAFSLLERAAAAQAREGRVAGDLTLDLARLLADHYRDLPQAIARVREVGSTAPAVVDARAWEARWRAEVGDIAGASLAYGRLRDTIAARFPATGAPRPPEAGAWARWLVEAARFERTVQRDDFAAERHLAAALRLAPRDPFIAGQYREVAALVAAQTRRRAPVATPAAAEVLPEAGAPAEPAPAESAIPPPPDDGTQAVAPTAWPAVAPSVDDVEAAEIEVEGLLPRVQAGGKDADFLRLAELLDGLERDAELFALVSGRLEDAEGDDRQRLEGLARPLLSRLRERAEARGEALEAELYGAQLMMLEER